jgi:4-hydroxy 2-oxovalerate aldolase
MPSRKKSLGPYKGRCPPGQITIKKFSYKNLEDARNGYDKINIGDWSPEKIFKNRDILLLGSGPGIYKYKEAIESYIKKFKPIVVALNTQTIIDDKLVKYRIASHPIRLMSDYNLLNNMKQPIIMPYSSLPKEIKNKIDKNKVLNFGLKVEKNKFIFNNNNCTAPSNLVLAYALGIFGSGKVKNIFFVGFDGYILDDPRTKEINNIFEIFNRTNKKTTLLALTPSKYNIPSKSIYGF